MKIQKLNILNGQLAVAGLVVYQSWTVTIQKIIRIVVSRFFTKKNSIFFILIQQQDISNQRSLVIGPIGFLISSKKFYLVCCSKAYGRFDF